MKPAILCLLSVIACAAIIIAWQSWHIATNLYTIDNVIERMNAMDSVNVKMYNRFNRHIRYDKPCKH